MTAAPEMMTTFAPNFESSQPPTQLEVRVIVSSNLDAEGALVRLGSGTDVGAVEHEVVYRCDLNTHRAF